VTSQSERQTATSPLATRHSPLRWEVFTRGGRTPTGKDAVVWAKEAERRGVGEILLTSMDRDGTKQGYDHELTKAISTAVGIPVIASGGAGSPAHFYDALTAGGADAALAASLFHFGELSIGAVKQHLALRGVAVRTDSNT
jgi:cyclase